MGPIYELLVGIETVYCTPMLPSATPLRTLHVIDTRTFATITADTR